MKAYRTREEKAHRYVLLIEVKKWRTKGYKVAKPYYFDSLKAVEDMKVLLLDKYSRVYRFKFNTYDYLKMRYVKEV